MKIIPAFQPDLYRVYCPYPMKGLDLYFTLRWLDADRAAVVRAIQKQAHQSPPADTPEAEAAKPQFNWPSHTIFGTQPPWEFDRKLKCHRVPPAYRGAAARYVSARRAGAIRCFEQAIMKTMRERGLLPRETTHRITFGPRHQYVDVYAVYAGFVRCPGVTQEDFPFERAMSEHEIWEKVAERPRRAEEYIDVICEEIEINFKQDDDDDSDPA